MLSINACDINPVAVLCDSVNNRTGIFRSKSKKIENKVEELEKRKMEENRGENR